MPNPQTSTVLLEKKILEHFGDKVKTVIAHNLVTVELSAGLLIALCTTLRDHTDFSFDMLIDLCGVDYLQYGVDHWQTDTATYEGFSRAVSVEPLAKTPNEKPRFIVVYHLLSITHNHRLRLKVVPEGDPLVLPSVLNIWSSANWYERETFDLFGISFDGHPDLRRILTDYHFEGHPMQKDFPVFGHTEMRYDEELKRVVYEPVSIEKRELVPKVIRKDCRYVRN